MRFKNRAVLAAADDGGQRDRARGGLAQQVRQRRQARDVGAQLPRDYRAGQGAVGARRPGRGLERQMVKHDPLADRRAQRHSDAIAEDRAELSRQQRRRRDGPGQAERGFVGDREGQLGIEAGKRPGRGGQPAAPTRGRPGALQRQRQRQTVAAAEQAVGEDAARLARLEIEGQRRRGPRERHRQFEAAGLAVDAVEVERGMRAVGRHRGAAAQGCGDAFTEDGRRQLQPADRQPVEGDGDRQTRHDKVIAQPARRLRRRRPRHLGLGDRQRADMRPPGEEGRARNVEADVAQGQIRAVGVGDFDPRGGHAQRREPAQPVDRNAKIRCADGAGDGIGEPGFCGRRLQQRERGQQHECERAQRDAEPAKQPDRRAHQKA